MRVLVGKTTYGMNQSEFEKLLKVASNQVPCGIYAILKGDYCELKNDKYKSLDTLDKKVAEYQKQGFTVYYNSNVNPKQLDSSLLGFDYGNVETLFASEKGE